MSRMSEIHLEVMELLANGLTEEAIAAKLNIPLDWVDNIADELNSPDDGMDGDHASALASAGWGTDEDYVADNDFFDDWGS